MDDLSTPSGLKLSHFIDIWYFYSWDVFKLDTEKRKKTVFVK